MSSSEMKTSDKIYLFLKKRLEEGKKPPSYREIGDAVGIASPSTVRDHLNKLEKKGLIRRDPFSPRAIELLGIAKPRLITAAEIEHVIGDLKTIAENTENESTARACIYAVKRLKQVLE